MISGLLPLDTSGILSGHGIGEHDPLKVEESKAKQLADNYFMSQIRVIRTGQLKTYACLLCGLTRNRRALVRNHLMVVHREPLSDKIIHSVEGNQQIFTCKLCGKITLNKAGMDLHLTKHEDNTGGVKCQFCGQICKNSHGLITHQRLTCIKKTLSMQMNQQN